MLHTEACRCGIPIVPWHNWSILTPVSLLDCTHGRICR